MLQPGPICCQLEGSFPPREGSNKSDHGCAHHPWPGCAMVLTWGGWSGLQSCG